MKLHHQFLGMLLLSSLLIAGCAVPVQQTTNYPPPMPGDISMDTDQGLMSEGWDKGHPLRIFAFLLHPVGIAMDLLIDQPLTLLASQYPDVFGYTVQDEMYRNNELTYRYHWRIPERQ